jgi:hypothetical protein
MSDRKVADNSPPGGHLYTARADSDSRRCSVPRRPGLSVRDLDYRLGRARDAMTKGGSV